MPATHLAFDDTDSPEGMCTTYLAATMIDALSGFDLIGLPRLVRLNPNVPWKTRGNAAVALAFGKGRGESIPCGNIDGRDVRCFPGGVPVPQEDILGPACEVVEEHAEFGCDKTNPGVVCTVERPAQWLYWRAVRSVVRLPDVERLLDGCGASWRKFKNGRGVIGAASALSWRPHDRTWEVVAYRSQDRVGTPRDVDPESVIEMDERTEHTFHNYDHDSRHVAITPASPCPVLFGIRGDSLGELLTAREEIRGEPQARWLLFLSNQGTDDHIVPKRVRGLHPGDSVRVEAAVAAEPRTIPGGHVLVRLSDGAEVDAAFYEPSGAMRTAARALAPGDEVVVYGSVRDTPRSINVEKMRVARLAEARRKVANPMCRGCGKRMGSLGKGQGYRCKRCGGRAPPERAEYARVARTVAPGWYEPPVASRRHLYKPVRRMSKGNINNLL